MTILQKIRQFHDSLDRKDFYDFYSLVCSMAGPPYDYIKVDSELINVKKIVRRIRITVMHPRFEVDYAQPYDAHEAHEERKRLLSLYDKVQPHEKNLLAKLIGALELLESE